MLIRVHTRFVPLETVNVEFNNLPSRVIKEIGTMDRSETDTPTHARHPDYAVDARTRSANWKQQAKVRHKIVGIQTWPVNLNPTAMSRPAFSSQALSDNTSTQIAAESRKAHVDWRGPFAAQAGALIVGITTDKGLKGYGLGGGGLAGALVIDRHMKYSVLDCDPLDVEEIWDRLYHVTSI